MKNVQTLKKQGNKLSNAAYQLELLEHGDENFILVPFQQKLENLGLFPLKPVSLEILQVNIGKMCNQTCRHCHVDAGPDRKEIMTQETMQQCLDVLKNNPSIRLVDITGGAPEMNPNFHWFVSEINELGKHIIIRCNLTIILSNKKYFTLPQFYKQHNVEIISSLPFYSQERTDRQRGEGVFEQSIKALQMLNEAGYGKDETGLKLNLVYNPAGAFLPPSQQSLQKEYKHALKQKFNIDFNELYTITNMPINRYLDYLLNSGNYEMYMEKLVNAFNPAAALNVMCRNMVSVGWDGSLYDCDFNQMLELKLHTQKRHISNFNFAELQDRTIVVGQHCYGCTAGLGSSCGGSTTS